MKMILVPLILVWGNAGAVRDHSNILALINHYRNIHGANSVTWDTDAQYASYEAAIDICEKTGGNLDHKYVNDKYGSNLLYWNSESAVEEDGVKYWYKEASIFCRNGYYGNSNPPYQTVGRFTALVWKGTTKMGTWKHTCSNGRTVVVLTTKDKQGNYRGEYASNVGRPNDGSCGGRGGIQETVNSSKNDKAEVSDPAVRDHSNILALINHYRNIHGANNVEWDANCQYAAYEAARDICEKNGGNLDHKYDKDGYGSNLYVNYGSAVEEDGVKSWYEEASIFCRNGYYGDSNPPYQTVGHFTALVWKGTTKMGTWKHTCSNGRTVVVLATKDKQPNYRGEFASNVGRPNDGSCGRRGRK